MRPSTRSVNARHVYTPTKFICKNSGGAAGCPCSVRMEETPSLPFGSDFCIKKKDSFSEVLELTHGFRNATPKQGISARFAIWGNRYIPSDIDTTASERLPHPETSSFNICFSAAPSSGQKKNVLSIARGRTRPQRKWKIKQMRNYMLFSS